MADPATCLASNSVLGPYFPLRAAALLSYGKNDISFVLLYINISSHITSQSAQIPFNNVLKMYCWIHPMTHIPIYVKWTFITFCNIYIITEWRCIGTYILTNICGVSSHIHILNQKSLVLLVKPFNHLPQTIKLSPTIRFTCFVPIYCVVVFLYFCEASWK